jgi:hypothetical protein
MTGTDLQPTSPAYEDLGPTRRSTYSEPPVPPRIGRIIGELGLRYRPSVQADLEAHAATLALLTRDVAHMRPETLERAARTWAQEERFMPKAAELIGLCRKLEKPNVNVQASCERANAQLATNGTNEKRRSEGLPPVRWVVRDNRVQIENAT